MIPVLLAGLLGSLSISFEPLGDDPARVRCVVAKAPARSELRLYRIHPGASFDGPGIFAKTSRDEDGELVLTPRFALSRGETYRAVLRDAAGEARAVADWTVPERESPAPRVVEIHPKAPVLPANLLKFYIRFTEPMREERAVFEQIHLEDEEGRRVADPWRRQELWSDQARRLTLWIHPGRVKQGVDLRETMGPVLEPGRTYTLVLDGSLRSAAGEPMGEPWRHPFHTGPADRTRPSLEAWTLTWPAAGTRDPLLAAAPEPLDHALLRRHLRVTSGGDPVAVRIEPLPGARGARIVPVHPWTGAPHRLEAGRWLEDLAGNTPERLFDTDLAAGRTGESRPVTVRAFTPR